MDVLKPGDYVGIIGREPGDSAAAYLAAVARREAKVGAPFVPNRTALVATVNHNRWVADCPNCAAGIALDPDAPDFGACFSCRRVYSAVAWPPDRAAIEEALEPRPWKNRNWVPSETVEDLLDENAQARARGVL